MVKARSYRHTENISLNSEPNTVKPLISRRPVLSGQSFLERCDNLNFATDSQVTELNK